MKTMKFYKIQASGNDFILIEAITAGSLKKIPYSKLARKVCERKLGAGADGLLIIEPSRKAQFKMRIFNSDGSEAEMCGNGARCAAFWYGLKYPRRKTGTINFETKAGIIASKALSSRGNAGIRIKMTEPFGLKQDLTVKVFGKDVGLSFINTGVPHAVVFVYGLDSIDIEEIGREIRFHKKFAPAGTNVDFIEVLGEDLIKIRTYERGVESETLACGTGCIASAIVSSLKLKPQLSRPKIKMNVRVRSNEILKVYFDRNKRDISNVWLEGKVSLVYKGEFVL